MKLLNVIGYGSSCVICAALLVACADGRGTNGFRSYQYSKDERAKNLALKEARDPKPKRDLNAPGADDSQKTGDLGVGTSAPQLPEAPSGRPDQSPLFTDTAKPQVLATEPGKPATPPKPNPSGVADLSAKVKDFNVTIEGELRAGMNETAKGLVKGITVVPKGDEKSRMITIQANVIINKEEVYMEATDVPVKFLKDDETIENMLFTLTKPCETENNTIAVKNMLQASAKCVDEKCNQIVVMLSFETQNPNRRATAVLVVSNSTGGWAFTETNIGTPKTFEQSQKACPVKPAKPDAETGGPAAPSATPAPAPAAPVAAPVGEPAQTEEQKKAAELEKKEREAADAKWCEEVKKEGFSCDDSPGEIARMRNMRKAQLERGAVETPAPAPSSTPAAPATTMPAPAAEADQVPAVQTEVAPATAPQASPHEFGTDADTDAPRADHR